MNRFRKTVRSAALLLAALLLLAMPCAFTSCGEKAEVGIEVGDLCAQYTLDAYDGREEFNVKETRGKVTVLNFWATWCPPCVAELSTEFPRVTEEYGDKVAIVAVHVTSRSEDVQAYIDTNYADYDVIFCQDEEREPNDGGVYYNLTGGEGYVPYTLILDGDGVIAEKITGATDFETLKGIIDGLLDD